MSASVVPARAGMSPVVAFFEEGSVSGPRASGDEPGWLGTAPAGRGWSPRERG